MPRPLTLPFAAALGLLALLAAPSSAQAQQPDGRDDGKPWSRGILMPSLGAGGSFGGDISQLYIGAGVSYYVINGLAVGLSISNDWQFYSENFKLQYPGINEQLPTYKFGVLPTLQYVFFRNQWFSPYAFAGTGPVIHNNGGGTLGQWAVGPGFYIGTGGPVFIDIGVSFNGLYTQDACVDTYTSELYDASFNCNWGWGLRLGLVLAFDVGKRRRSRRPENEQQSTPSYTPTPPPQQPGYVEPAPYEPYPAPTEPPPESAPPLDATEQPAPVQPAPVQPAPQPVQPAPQPTPAPQPDVQPAPAPGA